MFFVGLIGGVIAQSTGLIADALDMLADSFVYALALLAIGRSIRFKTIVATLSGSLLLILGFVILIDVGRRYWFGSEPESLFMIGIASISLFVNVTVLRLLQRFQQGDVHLRAAWVFTRTDVIANLGVIMSGILVAFSNSNYPDLLIGAMISLYVMKEALGILKDGSKQNMEKMK
ncbi:MAG: cation transporter [Legionellales bacterium]|jgi:cation diffusion facilitator family transporter